MIRRHRPAGQVLADDLRHGVEVGGVIVKRWHEAQGRDAPLFEQSMKDGIIGRPQTGRRILRIHRHHNHPIHPGADHLIEDRRYRRMTDLHAKAHRHLGQCLLQQVGLLPGEMQQWRPGPRVPDPPILRRRFRGTRRQDAEVEDQPPKEPRCFDDARIAEKLPQIAAQGGCGRFIGRAELHEKNGGVCHVVIVVWSRFDFPDAQFLLTPRRSHFVRNPTALLSRIGTCADVGSSAAPPGRP